MLKILIISDKKKYFVLKKNLKIKKLIYIIILKYLIQFLKVKLIIVCVQYLV